MFWYLVIFSLYHAYAKPNHPTYNWKQTGTSDSWTPCSVTCGEGFSYAIFNCFREVDETFVAHSFCDNTDLPERSKKCPVKPCPRTDYAGYWYSGLWGECSATCGQGIVSRIVMCVKHDLSGYLDEKECPLGKPDEYKPCEISKCPVKYSWFAGEWGECSSDCDGTRTRKIQCKTDGGIEATDGLCVGAKPIDEEACVGPCSHWVTGKWRRCKFNRRKQSCREATQVRCIICLGKKTSKVSRKCDSKTKPVKRRNCSLQACT